MTTRVDPLTSILAVMARSCQTLTTSWQPWVPWQDSHQDLTEIIHYFKIVSYHDGQNSKIIKNTIPSVQASETQSEGFHFTQQRLFLLVFRIKCFNLLKKICKQKLCKKITITYSGFRKNDENPNNSSPV